MAEVVGLRGVAPPGAPVPEVVKQLEELLERARSGEIRAIAFANVRRDGTVGTGWAKPPVSGAAAMGMEDHGLGSGILTLAFTYAAPLPER